MGTNCSPLFADLFLFCYERDFRIPLKPVHIPIVLINRLNKTESAVFLYCMFSLFLKDPLFQIIHVVSF